MRLSIAKRQNIKRIYTRMQVHAHFYTRTAVERREEEAKLERRDYNR